MRGNKNEKEINKVNRKRMQTRGSKQERAKAAPQVFSKFYMQRNSGVLVAKMISPITPHTPQVLVTLQRLTTITTSTLTDQGHLG